MTEHQTILEYEDQDHVEYSSYSSHKEEEEEEHVPDFQEDKNKEATRRTTWHCHIITQSVSSISWHVLSQVIICYIIVVDYVITYSKCIVKWNSKGHIQNMKSHVKSKSHRK